MRLKCSTVPKYSLTQIRRRYFKGCSAFHLRVVDLLSVFRALNGAWKFGCHPLAGKVREIASEWLNSRQGRLAVIAGTCQDARARVREELAAGCKHTLLLCKQGDLPLDDRMCHYWVLFDFSALLCHWLEPLITFSHHLEEILC